MKKSRNYYKNNLGNSIVKHINSNIKDYAIILGIFIIGIIVGISAVNSIQESNQSQIEEYINNSLLNFQNNSIDNKILIISSLKGNIIYLIILLFLGSTGIGSFFIYLLVGFKGFCISYSISAFVATLGIGKGSIFIFSYFLLPNIILVFLIFFISVKGILLNKEILNNNKKYINIKLEIIKHLLLIIVLLLLVAIIETYVSSNLLKLFMKYIL